MEMMIFGFAVSLDSFSVGLGLKLIYSIPYIAAIIISVLNLMMDDKIIKPIIRKGNLE